MDYYKHLTQTLSTFNISLDYLQKCINKYNGVRNKVYLIHDEKSISLITKGITLSAVAQAIENKHHIYQFIDNDTNRSDYQLVITKVSTRSTDIRIQNIHTKEFAAWRFENSVFLDFIISEVSNITKKLYTTIMDSYYISYNSIDISNDLWYKSFCDGYFYYFTTTQIIHSELDNSNKTLDHYRTQQKDKISKELSNHTKIDYNLWMHIILDYAEELI